MKPVSLKFPEFLHIFSFLLFLFASSMTHIERGSELSLWLMTFAVVISGVTTILPGLGIRWLHLEKKGSDIGRWLAVIVQIASWGAFGYAMYLRLDRNLPPFHILITLTTLLWASWLLIFIYSRHACITHTRGDTLINIETHPDLLTKEEEKQP